MSCGLVLLPGMDGTGELFSPLLNVLGSDIETLAIRYPDRPLDYAGHESFVRERLPHDRSYVVVGESFSGPIAIALAAVPPPGMLGYVLCVSFVCCPRAMLKVFRPVLGFVPVNTPSSLARWFLMGHHGSEPLRRAHAEVVRNGSSAALRARLKAIAQVDVRQQLRRVQLPGLYLRATEDRMVPRAASRIFVQFAVDARVIDIEGPHFLLQTNPVAVANALRTFLAQVDAARRCEIARE